MGLMDRFAGAFRGFADAGKPAAPEFGEAMLANTLDRLFSKPEQASIRFNRSVIGGRKGLPIYGQMIRDDQVKAALALKRYAVTAAGWQVHSPKDTPDDWEPQTFVEENLNELPRTLEQFIDEVLSAFAYGYSVTEKVWEPRDGKIALCDLKTRDPFQLYFDTDGFGNVKFIRQLTQLYEPEKFVIYVHDGKFSNPYGESDLDAAYRPWWIKDNAYKWMAMYLERMGIPPIFALYDQSLAGQVQGLKDILSRIQAATVGVIPRTNKDSLELWSPAIESNVQQIFIPALRQFNGDIARSILVPDMMGLTPDGGHGTGGGGKGSGSRSTVHFDIFMLVIERIRTLLTAVINRQVIRPLCDYNFAGLDDKYPMFQFLPIGDELKVEMYTEWRNMVNGGVVTAQKEDEQHIREIFDFPDGDQTPMDPRPAPVGPGNDRLLRDPSADPAAPSDKTLTAEEYAAKLSKQSPDQAKRIMDAAEKAIMARVTVAINEARDIMLAVVKKNELNVKFVNTLQLRKMGDVQSAFEEGLRGVWSTGRALQYVFTPSEAVSYLKQKALEISGVMRDDILSKSKIVLLNAIKNGEPLGDTILKLGRVFEPYIGGLDFLDDVTNPFRLETIVRTNVTDAYNQGRIAMAKDPDLAGLMAGMRYSSIIDERTTEICNLLNGKMFHMDDPALERLSPPNHFNCRSILVAVTKGEAKSDGIDSTDYIDHATTGEALALRGNFTDAVGLFKQYREAA